MKKILSLVKDLEKGGGQIMTARISKIFIDKGYDCQIMTALPGKNKIQFCVADKMGIIPAPDNSDWSDFPDRVVYYIKKNSPDIVFSSYNQINKLLCHLKGQGRISKKVKLITRIDIPLGTHQPKGLSGVNEKLSAQNAYNQSDMIIVQCPELEKSTREYLTIPDVGFSKNIKTILNPTLDSKNKNRKLENPNHNWLKKGRGYKTIIAAGRLAKAKGFENLLESFSEVLKQGYEVKLIIIGEGDERQNLERQIEKLGIESSVDLPGNVENPSIFFAVADLFVLSSRHEGLPNVMIEAMAQGLPVVATDCKTGPRDLSKDSKFVLLVPVNDVKSMTSAIIQALNNPLTLEEKELQINHMYNKYNKEQFAKSLDVVLEILFGQPVRNKKIFLVS